MLVGNYGGGNGCVDNDDGSLWFDNNHNFAVYGHQKFKVGAIRSYGNVLAYVSGFGEGWQSPGEQLNRANDMYDNVVIYANGSTRYHDCSNWTASGQRLYAAAPLVISGKDCPGGAPLSLAQWQALAPARNDVGTTLNATMPSGAEIVAWGRALVGM
jgi:hypothetical protein